MKRTTKIMAGLASSVALAATLAMGGVAPTAALAETDGGLGTGTLTINKSEGNTVTQYKAIKIFEGDVKNEGTTENPKWVIVNPAWANDNVKAAVEEAIKTADRDYAGTTAQDATEFLLARIDSRSYDTIVSSDSFANTLTNTVAGAMADANNTFSANYIITPGQAKQIQEGYYLVLVDLTGLPEGASATSPIMLLMGDEQTLAINEKVTVPTIAKTVVEDSAPTDKSRRYADAQVGQDLSFTLTGTVAGNIANFPQYQYKFTDTLSAGLTLKVDGGTNTSAFDEGDIVVKITNTSDTSAKTTYTISNESFEATYAANATDANKHDLMVNFSNLKAATGTAEGATTATSPVPIDKTSVVTVDYVASLNGEAVTGTTTGNPNEVFLTYSTTPNMDFTGNTTKTNAVVYDYALKLKKVDKDHELDGNADTNIPLNGAKFTIQATTTDEGTDNNGKYLKNDGTFGASTLPETTDAEYNNYLFTTANDGSFTVKGLDGGTYVITEIEAPTDYDPLDAPLTLTITVGRDNKTQQPNGVTASLSGGEGDGQDTTNPPDQTLDIGTRASFDAATGTITITATNQKKEQLPITGLPGITMVYVVGGVILVASLAVIVRRHMHEGEQA